MLRHSSAKCTQFRQSEKQFRQRAFNLENAQSGSAKGFRAPGCRPLVVCYPDCPVTPRGSSLIAPTSMSNKRVTSRKQSAPFAEFGRSVTGQGRFRAAMPVWRLTDNSDSILGQRRRRKYQLPLSIQHRRGRLQAVRRRSAPSVGRREQELAGDVSGGQSPVDAETSVLHLAAVRVPAARAAMSLR